MLEPARKAEPVVAGACGKQRAPDKAGVAVAPRKTAPGTRSGHSAGLTSGVGAFALLLAAIIVLYWTSIASLWERWRSDDLYSHGWLIFLISGWLVWLEARAGRLDEGRPSTAGVAVLPLLGAIWLVAVAGSIGVVQWLLLPALAFAAAFAMFGRTALRRLWFPIGFTLFAIPIWNGLALVLQEITVSVTGSVLTALGVTVFLDGHRVELPVGRFEIVEGCSGIRYFLVSATLASLYGWLWYRRLGATLALVAAALAIALVANWLRVVIVIYAGYVTDMQHYLVAVDHYYFGWVLYMVMLVPLFWFARHWDFDVLRGGASPPVRNPADHSGSGSTGAVRWLPSASIAMGLLVAAPLVWGWVSRADTRPPPEALPAGAGGWTLNGPPRPDWEPGYRGADDTLGGSYWRDGQGVDAWIIYYRRPSQGRELASQSNRLATRRDGQLQINGHDAVLRRPYGQRVIRFSHIVGAREGTGLLEAKVHQIIGTLSGRPEAALLAYSVPCTTHCNEARDLLAAFERDMGASLRAAILGRAPEAPED